MAVKAMTHVACLYRESEAPIGNGCVVLSFQGESKTGRPYCAAMSDGNPANSHFSGRHLTVGVVAVTPSVLPGCAAACNKLMLLLIGQTFLRHVGAHSFW